MTGVSCPMCSVSTMIIHRVRESNARLSDHLQEVKLENKALRQVSADYERVKRVFSPEQVEVAVQADKQREQAEKGQPRRSIDRGSGKRVDL